MSGERSELSGEHTAPRGAVFLSYASQDAAAARSICDALRAAGVEVWFDQNELVGGDAWDAKIRKQIAECTLFVPVISAATQARREGYFRLEWKLAAQRTHMMSERVAFLLPVVIDATRDAEADVPGEFKAVQWTRLRPLGYGRQARHTGEREPEEAGVEAFVARVRTLVGLDAASEARRAGRSEATPTAVRGEGTPPTGAKRFGIWGMAALAAVAVVAIGIGLWPRTRDAAPPSAPTAAAPVGTAPTASESAPAPVSDKAIAVLPFANRNTEAEGQYFVDGVQDELRTTLAAIRELVVVSGLSVERYRGTTKTYRQIGAELGVAYVLEGSVQRSGSRVRITGRLIDARTEAPVWSKSLEKEVRDVFAIQAELATAIAGELRAVLSPEEKKLVTQRPTESEEAFELYLRARAATRGDRSWGLMRNAEEWLQTAVNLDPRFAPAWLELSQVHGHFYSSFRDRSESRLARASAALEEAKRLVPDSPEVQRALASYHHAAGDQARAEELLGQFVRRQPNDSEAYDALGRVALRRGRWAESVTYLRRAVQLDPGNVLALKWLAQTLSWGRRYEEAQATYRRALTLVTPDLADQYFLAELSYRATGSTAAVDRLLAGFSPEAAASRDGLQLRFRWAAMRSDHAECLRILDQDPKFPDPHAETIWAFLQRGDTARARHRASLVVAERRRRLEAEPRNAQQWGMMGQYEAMVGNREAALEHARRAVELDPIAKDAYTGANRLWQQAFVFAWTGDKERALEAFARLIRMPHPEMNVHIMRRSFLYEPLRDDPRFQALLNDPKNNAPLF